MKYFQKTKGFTLIEILVVVGIIAVLFGIATPITLKMLNRSRQLETLEIMRAIKTAGEDYYEDHGMFYKGGFAASDNDVGVLTSDNDDIPLASPAPAATAATGVANAYLIALLGGVNSDTGKVYLGVKEAKGSRSGLVVESSTVAIVDAWGCGMPIIFDAGEDDVVDLSNVTVDANTDFENVVIRNAEGISIISYGPDAEKGNGDDLKSW